MVKRDTEGAREVIQVEEEGLEVARRAVGAVVAWGSYHRLTFAQMVDGRELSDGFPLPHCNLFPTDIGRLPRLNISPVSHPRRFGWRQAKHCAAVPIIGMTAV